MDQNDLPRRTLGEFLDELAARLPAPGAGAVAAIEAALAASLVAMIGRFTTDDEHAQVVRDIVAAADAQRAACLAAAADDETAFAAVVLRPGDVRHLQDDAGLRRRGHAAHGRHPAQGDRPEQGPDLLLEADERPDDRCLTCSLRPGDRTRDIGADPG